MKLDYDLYNIMKYGSTVLKNQDMFLYAGNHTMVFVDKTKSDFVEVDVPKFFDTPVIIRNYSKFLRLFMFNKPERGSTSRPESIQDWQVIQELDPKTNRLVDLMYLKMPGKTIKLVQGNPQFLQQNENRYKAKFDTIELKDSVKFQLSHELYKQIINDCSILDLDTINIKSVDENKIKIFLTKRDKGTNEDYSTYEIECVHKHNDTSIAIMLDTFMLIEAPDHQIEYGIFEKTGKALVLKVQSFYSNDYIVKKVIVGIESKVK